MTPLTDLTRATHLRDPGPGAPMTREELGEHLAHMVWESVSEFLVSEDSFRLFSEAGVEVADGVPLAPADDELLIFFLWAHARGVREAFRGRSDRAPLGCVLSALHRAVYSDLEDRGVSHAELRIFEQRLGARYVEYHRAAERSPIDLEKAVRSHLGSSGEVSELLLAPRIAEVADPLTDFLHDLQIVPEGSQPPIS